MTHSSEYVQRLFAGCPVEAPDPADDPEHGHLLEALYEVYKQHSLPAVRRSWAALCNADPAIRALLPDPTTEDFYGEALTLMPNQLADLDRFTYDESGQGEAFSDLFYDRLRYVPGVGWYIWTGRRWRQDDREAIVQYAIQAARARQQAARARPAETDNQLKARKKALRFAESAANLRRIQASIGIGKTIPGLVASHKMFDRQPHLLAVANGVVDLRTGNLLPAYQEQYISRSTTVPYFSDAQAPRWEQFISEIFGGRTDLIAYSQRAIGYSLTGSTTEQCFFLCYGTGANGKSTLLNVLKALAGDYGFNVPFNTLEHGRQSDTGQEIMQLRGRRVILSSETNDGSRLNEARIKAITGGDEVTGRYLYARTTISFVPTFKLWLATNHKPAIQGSDDGIWRRVRLIPFLQKFTAATRDRHLEETLKEELPGILAWAVRGAQTWHQQGLGEPPDVVQATNAYRAESDILGLFLDEETRQHEAASVQSSVLYQRYQAWTEANGLHPVSIVKFARGMEAHGFTKSRSSSCKVWQGITLREQA